MFTLQFDTGNAAFDDGNAPAECARILEIIGGNVSRGYRDGRIFDVNGNRIGEWALDLPGHLAAGVSR